MRALIDTCVVIDLLQKRTDFFDDAHSVFVCAANRMFDGFITAKSVSDIYYITHRYFHDDQKSRDALKKLFHLVSVLDTKGIDCISAIDSQTTDYEDAIMIETGKRENIDCIITRNEKDYMQSPVAVYSPSRFLKECLQIEENL